MLLRLGVLLKKLSTSTIISRQFYAEMFRISQCDAIGFDMDHTLCRYNIAESMELGHQGMCEYLVKHGQYSEKLLSPMLQNHQFVYNGGLVFDYVHHALLKLTKDGIIEKASIGSRFLPDDEITKIFPDKKWDKFSRFQDGVFSEPGSHHWFETNFGNTCTAMLSNMIDDKVPESGSAFIKDDFISTLMAIWGPEKFQSGESKFFEEIKSNPGKYLVKCSEKVISWLVELRKQGKIVFFITSSHCDMADHVMQYSFGPKWREYFDIVISRARKPGFFNLENPFLKIDSVLLKELPDNVTALERGGWYSEGNCKLLLEHLREWCGKPNPEVAYVGDSLRSDIVPSKKYFNWHTIYIYEGLRHEDNVVGVLDKVEETLFFSEDWGPVLHCEKPDSISMSLFADVIHSYATICVPSVEELAALPINHQFKMFNPDEIDSGYFPQLPDILHKK